MRIAGIDPGLRTGGLVVIDTEPGERGHIIRAVSLGVKNRTGSDLAADLALISCLVRDELAATAPEWVVIEKNIMAGGRTGGDKTIMGRGACLVGIGLASPNAWLEAHPMTVRKHLLGKPKASEEEISGFVTAHLRDAHLRLTTPHLEDAALLALWGASHVLAAQAGHSTVLA